MDKINFEDLPSQNSPINADNLNQLQENIEKAILKTMQLMFPVGSSYITQENVNPSTILGFGTWERSKGKVLVGLDENDTSFNTIGKTGGEKTHTLTIEEMPNHNHGFENGNGTAISPTVMRDGGEHDLQQSSGSRTYDYVAIGKTGGSQAHNNLQPYEVVGYMWIRRA